MFNKEQGSRITEVRNRNRRWAQIPYHIRIYNYYKGLQLFMESFAGLEKERNET